MNREAMTSSRAPIVVASVAGAGLIAAAARVPFATTT